MFYNATNLKNVFQRNLKQTGPGIAFLEHMKAKILKIYPLDTNHGGLGGLDEGTSLPKKTLDMSTRLAIYKTKCVWRS